jgi:hypothetical protein
VIRQVRAELLKVRSTRLWIGLVLGALLLNGAGAILLLSLAGTEQGLEAGLPPIETTEDLRTIVHGGAQAFLFVLVLAATMGTAEHRYGTAAGTYLATPRRERVVVAKSIAAVPIGAAFGISAGVLISLIVAVWTTSTGGPALDGSIGIAVAEDALQCAFAGALGAALGVAIRSQVVAILSILGWTLVIEPLVSGLLPEVLRWLPFAGAASGFGPDNPELFDRPLALFLMLGYLAAAIVGALVLERRRDV